MSGRKKKSPKKREPARLWLAQDAEGYHVFVGRPPEPFDSGTCAHCGGTQFSEWLYENGRYLTLGDCEKLVRVLRAILPTNPDIPSCVEISVKAVS